jgi:hypothetical protein
MKPKKHTTFGTILCASLALVAATAEAHKCKLSNVAGHYGYTSDGTIVTPPVGPFIAVGRATFTESGTVEGTQTASIAGNIFANETIQGTFTVNPDCTGFASVNVYHGSTLVRTSDLFMVWDDNQRGIRAVFLRPGSTIAITARRVSGEEDD